ncbi:MAG: hypothetical protein ACM3SQ_16090 [Betaproteobacteria bacterium]
MLRTGRAAAFLVSAGASVALWLSSGSLALGDAARLDSRVALLPSVWPLAVLVAIAALACASRVLTAEPAMPLAAAAVLLLPWLPFPVPAAALTWTGPIRFLLWGALLFGVLIAADLPRLRRLATLVGNPRSAPVLAAVVAALLYAAGYRAIAPRLPGGDEPHYLIITQSLLRDHDLEIENNHLRGDYREYFPGVLRPDYLRRGRNGEIYSVHAPGLPALAVPAFALGGYHGVVAFLILLAALSTAFVWIVAYRLTNHLAAAWFAWAAIAFSVTFFFHAFTVYPDIVGAAIVIWTVTLLVEAPPGASRARLMAHGAALALLPWLHTRFALLAAALGAIVAVRQIAAPDRIRRLVAFLLIPAVSAAGWFLFFFLIYGTPSPTAPYGQYTQTSLKDVPWGATGLLIDQQFGLLPNAPVLAFALVGWLWLARRRLRLALELAVVALPYALATAAYHMWWGGTSAPARFLVPVVPLLALPAAAWYAEAGPRTRIVALAALTFSLAITATLASVDRGAMVYQFRDGVSLLLERAAPLVDLPRAAPSLFRGTTAEAWRDAFVWIAALALALGVTAAVDSWRGRAAGALTGLVAVPLSATLAIGAVWRVKRVAGPTPSSAQIALLQDYTGPNARAFEYHGLLLTRAGPVVRSMRIASSSRRDIPADGPLLAIAGLPPGAYAIEARQSRLGPGELRLDLGRQTIDRWPTASGGPLETRRPLNLPVPVPGVWVYADKAAREVVTDVVLRPIEIVARSDRLTDVMPNALARYGETTVFNMAGGTYVEAGGLWIRPGADAELVVSPPANASALRLSIRNGPVSNTCTVWTREWRQTLQMTPGQQEEIGVPVPAGASGLRLQVRSATGFVPAQFDPGSRDRRILGCRVEFP